MHKRGGAANVAVAAAGGGSDMAERFYTVIGKDGIEESRAVTPSTFKKELEGQGYHLGFATDGNREPYSAETLKVLERGAKRLEADGKARGIATFIGPEAPTPDVIPGDEPKAKVEPKAKADA